MATTSHCQNSIKNDEKSAADMGQTLKARRRPEVALEVGEKPGEDYVTAKKRRLLKCLSYRHGYGSESNYESTRNHMFFA